MRSAATGLVVAALLAGSVALGTPDQAGGRAAAAPREHVDHVDHVDHVGSGAARDAATSAFLPASPASVDPRLERLRREVDRILEGGSWRRGSWGVLAVSLDAGDTLISRNPAGLLAPASNMKLLTTAAALHHLGPDYRYRTFVLARGTVEDGVLDGDLVLYGTGDPGLSERFHDSRTAAFDGLADQVRAAGIREVRGRVVGDGTFFRGPVLASSWDTADLNDWFAAPASALAFNENVVTFRISPGPWRGRPVRIRTLPEEAGVPVRNTATTGPGRVYIDRERPTDSVTVVGSIPVGGGEVWRRLTVGDPETYATRALWNALRDRGVTVGGGEATVASASASVLSGRRLWTPSRAAVPRIVAEHRSPPLVEYLEVVNKESHNLFAELTLKTLGRVVVGDGSFLGGGRVVKRFLADEVGVDTAGVVIADGSGLSEENRVSPNQMVALIDHMAGSGLWEPFWATLPEAGNPRELRRMYRTAAARNLRAKTGTIRGVSALSGLVRSAEGERIAFSIIGNGLPSPYAAKRQVEDRIGAELAELRRGVEPGVAAEAGQPARDPAGTSSSR